jgi:uncharacterized protein (TIGR03435 family)
LKIMGFLRVLLVVAIAGTTAFGQPPGAGKLTFEVASVRPSPPNRAASPKGIEVSGDHVHIGPMLLANLIGAAYGVPYYRIQGPNWLTELSTLKFTLFDVDATLPTGTGKADAPEMLRSLLAERFALSVEVGNMEVDGLALTVAKNGPKLRPKVGQGDASPRTKDDDGRVLIPIGAARIAMDAVKGLYVESSTTPGLVDYFSMYLAPMPVLDETGLTDEYDVKLNIPLPDIAPSQPGERVSVEELHARSIIDLSDAVASLGLRLERRKFPVKTVIVKHVEQNPTAN